jgi:hypothetical protein
MVGTVTLISNGSVAAVANLGLFLLLVYAIRHARVREAFVVLHSFAISKLYPESE